VFIIVGGVVALVLFFVLLGCIIARLIPKQKELTAEEKVAEEAKQAAVIEVPDEEPKDQRSRCCTKCTIPHISEIKMTNWVFLICTTIMCCLGSMTIGQALFNDGPIADIVEVQQEWPPFISK
jgi:hypothetical protein